MLQDYFKINDSGTYHLHFEMSALKPSPNDADKVELIRFPPVDVEVQISLKQVKAWTALYGVRWTRKNCTSPGTFVMNVKLAPVAVRLVASGVQAVRFDETSIL